MKKIAIFILFLLPVIGFSQQKLQYPQYADTSYNGNQFHWTVRNIKIELKDSIRVDGSNAYGYAALYYPSTSDSKVTMTVDKVRIIPGVDTLYRTEQITIDAADIRIPLDNFLNSAKFKAQLWRSIKLQSMKKKLSQE